MWPFDYIQDGPYSPLQVEDEIPKGNWRDAFQDLLAIKNDHDLISERKQAKGGRRQVEAVRRGFATKIKQNEQGSLI